LEVVQFHLMGGAVALARQPPAAERLVLAFGSVERLEDAELLPVLRDAFPESIVVGCSTAGEITATGVSDGGITVTAASFSRTSLRCARARAEHMADSWQVGEQLAADLTASDLVYVLVLSDGVHVNGSDLVAGLTAGLPAGVPITGGLAGDDGRFERTLVLDGRRVGERTVVAVGFYGEALRVGHGSMGGWESFGPIRRVTRAQDNILYELDGRPALSIYQSYLGEDAENLPASGLLFPLALVSDDLRETGLIRTLLGVDRERGSLTFAGNLYQGGLVRLMHANFERLVDGSANAAELALRSLDGVEPTLSLLISCVGRRLLMGSNIEEEVEAVQRVLGRTATLAGFYSNGEISPFVPTSRCELHNQTMTITTFHEDA